MTSNLPERQSPYHRKINIHPENQPADEENTLKIQKRPENTDSISRSQ
jgi:hypothetical protein